MPDPACSHPSPCPSQNVEKEQKCPAFDHSCLGCHKPLRHDCTYCSLRCKVDVEYGFAPITPKGCLTPRDDGGVPAAVAAAAANMLLTAPPSARQQGGSRCAGGVRAGPPGGMPRPARWL